MKKCYDKEFNFVVPHLYCKFCGKWIKPGEKFYSVLLKWGDGRSACEECYNEYEIDWSLRKTEDE